MKRKKEKEGVERGGKGGKRGGGVERGERVEEMGREITVSMEMS